MRDNLEFIDRLRRITKEIMLNNFDVAYLSLGHARDELIKHYMEEKL